MDAPLVELLVRIAVAVCATVVLVIVLAAVRGRWSPTRPLLRVMAGVVAAQAVWRWYILWVGLQHDDGSYARDVEPYVRATGSALLFLLLFAVGLISWFHLRHASTHHD